MVLSPNERIADAIETELYSRFWKRLVMFASRRVPVGSQAEDVAQETLRRVLEAVRNQRVENLEALPAFVFQTARNVCMHLGRSARRERGALLKFSLVTPSVASENPVRDLLDQERINVLRDAIGTLDSAEQEFLQMLYVEGVDTPTLARRLGVDPGTLRVRKHRLVRRLAEAVAAESGNDSVRSGTKD